MNRIAAATVVFGGYTAVMVRLDRRMHAAGGPGIISFELAGTATRAERILSDWGPDGRRAARQSMWLDFGYMTSYGVLLGLLIDRRSRRQGHPAWLPAVAADAVEGVALLGVLDRRDIASNARRARVAAISKFAMIASSLAYCAYPWRTSGRTCR